MFSRIGDTTGLLIRVLFCEVVKGYFCSSRFDVSSLCFLSSSISEYTGVLGLLCIEESTSVWSSFINDSSAVLLLSSVALESFSAVSDDTELEKLSCSTMWSSICLVLWLGLLDNKDSSARGGASSAALISASSASRRNSNGLGMSLLSWEIENWRMLVNSKTLIYLIPDCPKL